MAHFVLTKQGYDQLIAACAGRPPSPLWLNAGVLAPAEVAKVRAQGIDVTVFAQPVPFDDRALRAAVDTIKEHHPGSSVWIEHVASP